MSMLQVEPGASATTEDLRSQREVIDIARDFIRELHGRRAHAIDVSPRSRLDRDLGIDSLGRT